MDLIQRGQKKPYIEFFFLDRKDLILNSFRFGNVNHYKNTIQEFFNLLDMARDFSVNDIKKTVFEFSLVINNIAFHLGLSMEHELSQYLEEGLPKTQLNGIEWLKKFIIHTFDTLYNKLYMDQQDKKKEQVYWIRSYIESHFDENISLNYFEETCYLCKEYLLKLFKSEFGYTIYEYTLMIRMKRAKELLLSSDFDIREITTQVGYNDSNYFCKAFKKYYGIAPSKYRKEYKSSNAIKNMTVSQKNITDGSQESCFIP